MITAQDIEREHKAALDSLTPEQRRALGRLEEAQRQTCFNGRAPKENLQGVFDREAERRSAKAA